MGWKPPCDQYIGGMFTIDMIAANGPYAVRQAKKSVHWDMQTDFSTAWRLSLECYEQDLTKRPIKLPERLDVLVRDTHTLPRSPRRASA